MRVIMLETIDFHVHFWKKEFLSNEFKAMLNNFAIMVNEKNFPNENYTPEKYLETIEPEKEKHKEFAIRHAVIFPIDYSFTSVKMKISYEAYMKYVINICDEFSDFFYAFAGPDPRHGSKALDLLEYTLGQCDCKGILFTPSTGFSFTHPNIEPMIQIAEKYEVPVVIHDTGVVPRPLQLFTEIYQLDELLSKFDKQSFIFCPFSQMNTDLMKVAIRHTNHIMADLTGYDSQFVSRKMPEMVFTQFLGMLKETFGSEKLLFGSDWPWWELTAPAQEWLVYLRKMKIPFIVKPFGFPSLEDEDKENILANNAYRILKLRPKI